ncbi:MAG: RluA family pseudouridine synthase [Bacteroidales bacterium]|nr:RluA family pseudouridine synthase [Bacteroidales bacterium]
MIFEDNHLLIINKAPSEIVQGDKTGDEPMVETLKRFLKEKYNKPGNVYLGVVHRLDRPTSGIVIFAKTSKALPRLNDMLQKHEIQKTYWAVVKNQPPKTEDHLIHYLVRKPEKNKSFAYKREEKNSKKAELIYKQLISSDNYHLLEVKLLTGRHHQIRSQLSSIKCPIKGDIKYGFHTTNKDASIHLHARRIEFIHPVTKEKIQLTAPTPQKDPIWAYFEKTLA